VGRVVEYGKFDYWSCGLWVVGGKVRENRWKIWVLDLDMGIISSFLQ